MPSSFERYDCVDCKIGSGDAPRGKPQLAVCSRCRMQRRREGRNRVEVFCLKCAKAMYPEARYARDFDTCPACRQAERREREVLLNPPPPDWQLPPKPPPGLREVLPEREFLGWPWDWTTDEDTYHPGNKAYVLTRNIKFHNREFQEGTVVLMNDDHVIFGRRKCRSHEFRGAIKLGWVVETNMLPTRFNRDDVI